MKEEREEVTQRLEDVVVSAKVFCDDLLREYVWQKDKKRDDKILDLYWEVLKHEKEAHLLVSSVSRTRVEKSLVKKVDEFSDVYHEMKNEIENLMELTIKG